MKYTLLILMAMITIGYSIVTIIKKNKMLKQTNRLMKEKSKSQVLFDRIDATKKMRLLLFVGIGFISSIMWLRDPSGEYTVQAVGIFILAVLLLELAFLDLRNVLFYNNKGFIYKGFYHRYQDIEVVGTARNFFRLGKIKFKNGKEITCFKEGLEILSNHV